MASASLKVGIVSIPLENWHENNYSYLVVILIGTQYTA